MALTTTELAEFTKRSRELMNDGGDHWMKGEYKEYDDYNTLRFCAVGAVREVFFDDAEGYGVDTTDPKYARVIQALADAVREELKVGRYKPIESARVQALSFHSTEQAESVVITFNDYDTTTWADVERVFKRAEETLAAA